MRYQACILSAAAVGTALCVYSQTAANPAASKGAPAAVEAQPLAPRASPADYPAHAQAGAVTVAAEFSGHFVPTPEATYSTEDFVAVEVGLFGEPGTRLTLSPGDFSLRVNGKKMPSPAQPFGLVMLSLKDPEWAPPTPPPSKKTSLNTGGGGGGQGDNLPPPPPHMPPELQHAMAVRAQKATLAEGDRPLPQAGLLFFPYRGQTKAIRSLELLYKGPAGQATLPLHP